MSPLHANHPLGCPSDASPCPAAARARAWPRRAHVLGVLVALIGVGSTPTAWAQAAGDAADTTAPDVNASGTDTPDTPPVPSTQPPQADGAPLGALAPPDPAQRLLDAVTDYQRGERARAQAALVALVVSDEPLPDAVRQEARVYLGELLYAGGQKEEAQVFFEQALRVDPGYRLDPFVHPPDVCAFFDYVRALGAPEAPPPVSAPPARMPRSVLSPIGAYHIQSGQKARGYAFQMAILGSASASVWMGGVLLSDRRYLPGTPEEAQLRALRRAQIGVSAATWGLYMWSVSDAARHWRSTTVGIGPRTIRLEGRF